MIPEKQKALSKEVGDWLLTRLIADHERAPHYFPKYVNAKGEKCDDGWNYRYEAFDLQGNKFKKNFKFDERAFREHFFGSNPRTLLGAYAIDSNDLCKIAAIDIDDHRPDGADDLDKIMHVEDQLDAILEVLGELGIRPETCHSKGGKGRHTYTFFRDLTPAHMARRFMDAVKHVAGLPKNTEVYPKQDTKGAYGNLLALPGSRYFCEKAKKAGRLCASWFIDNESRQPIPLEEWPALLRNIDLVTPERLAAAMVRLEEMGQKRHGKTPFVLGAPSTRRQPSGPAAPGSVEAGPDAWTPQDMEDFLSEAKLGFTRKDTLTAAGQHCWELDCCPWTNEHTDQHPGGSATYLDQSGVLGFKCFHAHCDGRNWNTFRAHVAPNSFKRKQRECSGKPITSIISKGVEWTPSGPRPLPKTRLNKKPANTSAPDVIFDEHGPSPEDVEAYREGRYESCYLIDDGAISEIEDDSPISARLTPETVVAASLREVGSDECIDIEEAEAKRIKEARKKHQKEIRLDRRTNQYLLRTAHHEKDKVFGGGSPSLGRPIPIDAKTGMPIPEEECSAKERDKIDKRQLAHQHLRTCGQMRRTVVGSLGGKKNVPDCCDKTGCCPDCADYKARDFAAWAAENWKTDRVTLITSGDGKYMPNSYASIARYRRKAEDLCKLAEKGPPKPRKKRLKKGEVAPVIDETILPEPVKPKKFPRRYFEGATRSVVIAPAELHEAIGRRVRPKGPTKGGSYANEVIPGDFLVESRVVSLEEAIKIIFGFAISETLEAPKLDTFADQKSVWMEPSSKLRGLEKEVQAHLTSKRPDENYNPEAAEAWDKTLDHLTNNAMSHPFIRAHKKKRTAANNPGKEMFSLPSPAELRVWKRNKLLEERPELANQPEEVWKQIELRHFGLLIYAVQDWQNKEPWECAKEIAEARAAYLASVGKDGFDLAFFQKAQAEWVDFTPEEKAARPTLIRIRPAFGRALAFASAG